MNKFKSGLWFKDGNFIREIDSGSLIAEIYISPNQNDGKNNFLTTKVNLISIAPEMFDFIERIVKEQQSHGSNGDMTIINEGLNLINKVKGLS